MPQKILLKVSIFVIIMVLAGTCLFGSSYPKKNILAIENVEIIVPPGIDLNLEITYLKDWLSARTNTIKQEVGNEIKPSSSRCYIILSSVNDYEKIKGCNFNRHFDSDTIHSDSYFIEASENNGVKSIYLIGKSNSGIRSAINRFIQLVKNDGVTLTLDYISEKKIPFINTRLVCIAPTGRRQFKIGSKFDYTNYELWDDNRLRNYPYLFNQFGLSGIQIAEVQGYGSISGDYLKKAQHAALTLARSAKDLKMFVSLDQWGDCLYKEGVSFCWEDAQERRILEQFYDSLAIRYSPYIDHIYIHVGDPGGATHKGCTKYKSTQLLTNAIWEKFKMFNPSITATLSTWANATIWKYYPKELNIDNYAEYFQELEIGFGQKIPDGAGFLDETYMPKEIGIALHRTFNLDQAKILIPLGRPVDVWGWYMSDMEMYNNLTINTKNLEKYYTQLPPEASKIIRIQTTDLCFQGFPNYINVYFASAKMWNPYRDREEIEREFCGASFGAQNADYVFDLYRAIENPWDYDVYGKKTEQIPNPSDIGTLKGNTRLRKVLDNAEKITFPKNWISNFTYPVAAPEMIDMMKARLKLLVIYSETMQKVNEERKKLGIDTTKNENAKSKIKIKVLSQDNKKILDSKIEKMFPLQTGQTLGQTFNVLQDFKSCAITVEGNSNEPANIKLTVYSGKRDEVITMLKFENIIQSKEIVIDGSFVAGNYFLEISNIGTNRVSVGISNDVFLAETMQINGQMISGDTEQILRIKENAIKSLPNLDIDPLYDPKSSAVSGFHLHSWADHIRGL